LGRSVVKNNVQRVSHVGLLA